MIDFLFGIIVGCGFSTLFATWFSIKHPNFHLLEVKALLSQIVTMLKKV